MKTKFCRKCGNKLEESWNACPNCGAPLSDSTFHERPDENPFEKRFRNPYRQEFVESPRKERRIAQIKLYGNLSLLFGIFSLIFGFVLGMFTGQFGWVILEIIFGILATIFGGVTLYKGEISYIALGGLILGGASLILFFYFMPLILMRY